MLAEFIRRVEASGANRCRSAAIWFPAFLWHRIYGDASNLSRVNAEGAGCVAVKQDLGRDRGS
jgi:hypothetical protein